MRDLRDPCFWYLGSYLDFIACNGTHCNTLFNFILHCIPYILHILLSQLHYCCSYFLTYNQVGDYVIVLLIISIDFNVVSTRNNVYAIT